ncbi:MAG: HAMP domain-containing protein [Pyrinomonadaceae bacterium]|nr:HAMP domain-containing protein [Pyrinomonadaceae bacterium]
MFNSLRIKLTFWYALILALTLIVFVLVFYILINQTVMQLADDSLDDASDALITRLTNSPVQSNESIEDVLEDFRFQYIVFVIYDRENNLIAASPRLQNNAKLKYPTFNISVEDVPIEKLDTEFTTSGVYTTVTIKNESNIRIFQENASIGGREINIATLRPLTNQTELLSNIRFLLVSGIPAALLLSILGGYYIAQKSLRPLNEMNDKASYISSHNLYERLPTKNGNDEVENLAATFNRMLGRLEDSFEIQKRFMSDASHELRTPLAIILGEAEVSLQKKNRPEEEYRESLEVIEQEGARLSKIVEDLFTLVRADADQYELDLSTFYLDELINETAKAVRTLVKTRGLALVVSSGTDLSFEGDEALIRRLIIILLDNAIKYSQQDGRVTLKCSAENSTYIVAVSNSGEPIPTAERSKIFERFYRAEASRPQKDNYEFGTGAGLGLAMGKWIAETHHGELLLSKSDESETVFTITLPKTLKKNQN